MRDKEKHNGRTSLFSKKRKMGLIINSMCAYITAFTDSVLKPDLETVLPVNQDGRRRHSQQSRMNKRVVGKEGLLIRTETDTFCVNP